MIARSIYVSILSGLLTLFLITSLSFAIGIDLSNASFKVNNDGDLMIIGVATDKDSGPDVSYRARFVWDADKNCLVLGDMKRLYPIHRDITVTIFWIGEEAGPDNQGISNVSSAWDEHWVTHYGGVDQPNNRSGYLPALFAPRENPFYVALPCNDLDDNGAIKPEAISYIYWADVAQKTSQGKSILKDRWVKIIKGDRTAYAQWEDVGPFGEDDWEYVFGSSRPGNSINQHAGIDVSPAVRDYLGLGDIDQVDWQFVEPEDVPDGPWMTVTSPGTTGWYRPEPGITWQWQLQGKINTNHKAELYDVDLFDADKGLIQTLHEKGRKVICYFSAGSGEEWRPDYHSFKEEDLGNELDGWPGERWLDIRSSNVRDIILKRLDLAVEKGCDGVEPDNVDGCFNDTGFYLTASDQIDFNRFVAMSAHERGLSVGLKNDLDQVLELQAYFDFALVEQCFQYDECQKVEPFVKNGKPVLDAEYDTKYVNDITAREVLCKQAAHMGISLLILPKDLNGEFRIGCH